MPSVVLTALTRSVISGVAVTAVLLFIAVTLNVRFLVSVPSGGTHSKDCRPEGLPACVTEPSTAPLLFTMSICTLVADEASS